MRFPRCFGLVAGISLLLAVPISASSAIAQVKVRLSHSALESSNSVWYVAQDRGLYKKNGLDAELLFIPSTTTSVSSLVAGDVQVANASGAGRFPTGPAAIRDINRRSPARCRAERELQHSPRGTPWQSRRTLPPR